jgi:hypothetical protein
MCRFGHKPYGFQEAAFAKKYIVDYGKALT